jgi:hypothetical protein
MLLLLLVQVLQSVLVQAAQPYSASATGKLHYYLTEGMLVKWHYCIGQCTAMNLALVTPAALVAPQLLISTLA